MASQSEYWHGFVLGNHVIKSNRLTATPPKVGPKIPPQYNLIGIIKDGDNNFHYGFINNPNPEYTCKTQPLTQNDYYVVLKNRIDLTTASNKKNEKKGKMEKTISELKGIKGQKTQIQQYLEANSNNVLNILLYVMDIFSFIVFETFFNTPNNENRIQNLNEISSILVNNKFNPDNILPIYRNRFKIKDPDDLINFVQVFINGVSNLPLMNFIIKKDLTSKTNKTPIVTTPEFKCLFYVLSKLSKQHPFNNCSTDGKKIINPNELYTRNTSSIIGLDIGEGNVIDFLKELSTIDIDPNNKNPNVQLSKESTKLTYTYTITPSDTPLYVYIDIQKDGIAQKDGQSKMFIIAINVKKVDDLITYTEDAKINKKPDFLKKEKLMSFLKLEQNKPFWTFVKNVSVKEPEQKITLRGGDPELEESDDLDEVQIDEEPQSLKEDNSAEIGGNLDIKWYNNSTSRKNKTLRLLKNVKRLESW